MKRFTAALRNLLVLCSALVALMAVASDTPVATMAEILEKLNHFPSAEEKATLKAIADDENNNEAVRTIATAIHDMQHKVGSEDAARLEVIVADENNDDDVRTLAKVALGVEHKPNADQVQALRSLQ